MDKRKLDTKRLYKLGRVLVIFITMISIFIGFISFKNSEYYHEVYIKDGFKCSDISPLWMRRSITDQQWEKDSKLIDDCYAGMLKPYEDSHRVAIGAILTAIFLPLIFFGGTRLHKYLFPIKKNRDDQKAV